MTARLDIPEMLVRLSRDIQRHEKAQTEATQAEATLARVSHAFLNGTGAAEATRAPQRALSAAMACLDRSHQRILAALALLVPGGLGADASVVLTAPAGVRYLISLTPEGNLRIQEGPALVVIGSNGSNRAAIWLDGVISARGKGIRIWRTLEDEDDGEDDRPWGEDYSR